MFKVVWFKRGSFHVAYCNDWAQAEALRKQHGGIIKTI